MPFENPENIMRSWNVQTGYATGPIVADLSLYLAGGETQHRPRLRREEFLDLPTGVSPRAQGVLS